MFLEYSWLYADFSTIGNDIDETSPRSAEECMGDCDKTPNCDSVDYQPAMNKRKCHMQGVSWMKPGWPLDKWTTTNSHAWDTYFKCQSHFSLGSGKIHLYTYTCFIKELQFFYCTPLY